VAPEPTALMKETKPQGSGYQLVMLADVLRRWRGRRLLPTSRSSIINEVVEVMSAANVSFDRQAKGVDR